MDIGSANPKANKNKHLFTDEIRKITEDFLQRKEVVEVAEDIKIKFRKIKNKSIKKYHINEGENEKCSCQDLQLKNIDKFVNPITNHLGVKVTSEKQKLAWLQLQELKSSSQKQQAYFNQFKKSIDNTKTTLSTVGIENLNKHKITINSDNQKLQYAP